MGGNEQKCVPPGCKIFSLSFSFLSPSVRRRREMQHLKRRRRKLIFFDDSLRLVEGEKKR